MRRRKRESRWTVRLMEVLGLPPSKEKILKSKFHL